MPLYRPSQLKEFLHKIDKRPSKGLSQNFLIDGNIVQKILSICEINRDDLIVEVGPGPGVLTEAILEKEANVVAVEKDEILAKELKRLDERDRLWVQTGDFLQFPLEEELKKRLTDNRKAKVIASPPYHITTPIIEKIVSCQGLISHVLLVLQEEYVRRIVSKSGSKEYSSFSVFVQSYAKAENRGVISKNCFYPAPKVDSAILYLEMKEPPFPIKQMADYHMMVQRAFQQRRKKLSSSLAKLYDKEAVEKAFKSVGLPEDIRPERCSTDQFEQLFTILSK